MMIIPCYIESMSTLTRVKGEWFSVEGDLAALLEGFKI